MNKGGLNSEQWGQLLADHFFRPEHGGAHVLFYVDRQLLAELAGLSEEEAVESLVMAILPQLRRREPTDLFGPLLSQTVSWKLKGGDGPPPCLPALALAVLAASEMRREGKRSQSNYHAWFRDLIAIGLPDVEADSLWKAYASVYPALWGNLKWWLEERHGGELGRSTIAEDQHNTKYGFADSQTIFLSSDREKLSRFFRWIRLRPGEEISDQELLQYFRIWASRRDDLSPGARLMIAEGGLEQVQLGRLVAEAASRWEGVARDDEGRFEARLCLTLSRLPKWRLGLAAPCPPGFPRKLEIEHGGEHLVLEADDYEDPVAADEHRWYGQLPLDVGAKTLSQGLRLECDERVLRLAPQWLFVLHMSRDLGCWSSVEQIRPGEEAWLLVAAEHVEQICELLERRARPGWSLIAREGIAPTGWTLIRDVVIDPVEAREEEGVNRLIPRRSNRFSLDGGLPLRRGRNLYLSGGDPDVLLPPLPEGEPAIAVELDEAPIELEPGVAVISLSALAPPQGRHLVHIGSVRKEYETIWTLGNVFPPVELPIGHELRLADGRLRPASLDAASGAEAHEDGARICGSMVELGAEIQGAGGPAPLILPRGPQRRVLISDRPGELEEVEVPEEPRWMRRADLRCQHFEHVPSIAAKWLVTDARLRGLRVRRIDDDNVVEGAVEQKDKGALRRWAEIILACGPECAEPEDRDDWQRLRDLAGEVA